MELRAPDDLSLLSNAELAALIDEAVAAERRVSARRNNLQDRLDFLRSGGGSATTASGHLLEKLAADEQRVSDERKAIHRLIDRLNGERARRSG